MNTRPNGKKGIARATVNGVVLAMSACNHGCPETVESYCGRAKVDCPVQLSEWFGPGGRFCSKGVSVNVACGRFTRVTRAGASVSSLYFYDSQTGALVALFDSKVITSSCVAGPDPAFDEPECDDRWSHAADMAACADAGAPDAR